MLFSYHGVIKFAFVQGVQISHQTDSRVGEVSIYWCHMPWYCGLGKMADSKRL